MLPHTHTYSSSRNFGAKIERSEGLCILALRYQSLLPTSGRKVRDSCYSVYCGHQLSQPVHRSLPPTAASSSYLQPPLEIQSKKPTPLTTDPRPHGVCC